MQRLRPPEWNAAKTDAKGVTTVVRTGAKDVRTVVRPAAVAEASQRALALALALALTPVLVPAQSNSI
jgi:hypothetical protein